MEHIVDLDNLQFPVFNYKRHPNLALTPTNYFALAFGLYMITAPMMNWIDYNSPSLASALCFAGICEYLMGLYLVRWKTSSKFYGLCFRITLSYYLLYNRIRKIWYPCSL